MFKIVLAAFVMASSLNLINAECPNACSAHGKCGAYDMCVCYRNWMANDCSERICQFGLAHVDTPMGDLDSSAGALTGPGVNVITNDAMYPFGTPEQFPAMMNTDGGIITNSAHYYRECSNKGICDRSSANCQCFDGYSGSACQRASCPVSNGGMCSGHGTCETIKTIASWDNDNIYKLWDEQSTMGCVCDPGYDGPDCSKRQCKSGPDPLYFDDAANVRVSNYTYQIYTKASTTVKGNYSLIFYDTFGEDWETKPIDIGATCDTVTDALEALPNNVIASGSVRCFNGADKESLSPVDAEYTNQPASAFFLKTRFTIVFTQNFGRLKQIDINIHLDGARPTLYTTETTSTLGWHIYPNGFIGESDDLVPDLCEGVLVKLTAGTGSTDEDMYDTLTTVNTQQDKALKRCLGDSDGKTSTFLSDVLSASATAGGVSYTSNTDIYGWDFGNVNNPHLIKLVETTQDSLILGGYTSLTDEQARDPSLYNYPITKHCTKNGLKSLRNHFANNEGNNYCANLNPAGFYAVMYFSTAKKAFKLFTRPSADYVTTQTFHIYTSQGYMQMVNPNVAAFSHINDIVVGAAGNDFASLDVNNAHSNVMYLTNTTTTYSSSNFRGQIDCETAKSGFGNLDCINKDDYVMFLNTITATTPLTNIVNPFVTGNTLAAARTTNPIYPNMYKVKKIFRDDKVFNNDLNNPHNENLRHQMILDYGSNTKYSYHLGGGHPAAVYKFRPASTYTYVSQCSNHGICDESTGLCQCFAGYTSDNCGVQNALAK